MNSRSGTWTRWSSPPNGSPAHADVESLRARNELRLHFPLLAEFPGKRRCHCWPDCLHPSRPPRVMPGRGPRLRRHISAVIAAPFLWWFLQGVSITAAIGEIREARVSYLAAAVLLSLAGFAHRIGRWRYLVAPFKWVRMRSLAAAVFMGWTVSAILPGRAGRNRARGRARAVAKAFVRARCWARSCSNACWMRSLSSCCSFCH